jgi:putative peptidoglycan lipid II flippase
MTEVAEAVAHAHERGVYHRRLTPHHVLLKQSGAVRVVGLGVASALAPAGHQDTIDDLQAYEQLDVESLGKLLYACLVSRWPGAHIDQLRAAPTEHGRLLRPRQVRAGVSRELDAICDRILGDPPAHHRPRLTTADAVARALHLVDVDTLRPGGPTRVSPDLLRLDPVVVPQGPPPGLAPPRRRPKAYEPAPPTTLERGKAKALDAVKGDRRYVLAGVAVVLVLASVLGYLVSRSTGDGGGEPGPNGPTSAVRALPVDVVNDFDPQGEDGENPGEVGRVVDGNVRTGWTTTTYFGQAALGGLKDGVGVVLDLGGPRELSSLRIQLAGGATDVSVYASSPGAEEPRSLKGLRRIAVLDGAGPDASVSLPAGLLTRYVVVWLTALPEIEPDNFRGEIREITVQGRT